MMDRGRQGHGAAARHRTEADRNGRSVRERDDDILGIDLPSVSDDLSEDRLHTLTLRTGTASDVDLARAFDANARPLERTGAGALGIAAESKAEIAALRARRLLLLP